MIGMIVGISSNGVIGLDGKIPFYHSDDLKFFKKMTLNSTIIMGRKTFESIGKPLPERRNIVITSSKIEVEGIECFKSLEDALDTTAPIADAIDTWLIGVASIYEIGMTHANVIYTTVTKDIISGDNPVRLWLIGGASIYEIGMTHADVIYTTVTTDIISGDNPVRFPWINPRLFKIVEEIQLNEILTVFKYQRIVK